MQGALQRHLRRADQRDRGREGAGQVPAAPARATRASATVLDVGPGVRTASRKAIASCCTGGRATACRREPPTLPLERRKVNAGWVTTFNELRDRVGEPRDADSRRRRPSRRAAVRLRGDDGDRRHQPRRRRADRPVGGRVRRRRRRREHRAVGGDGVGQSDRRRSTSSTPSWSGRAASAPPTRSTRTPTPDLAAEIRDSRRARRAPMSSSTRPDARRVIELAYEPHPSRTGRRFWSACPARATTSRFTRCRCISRRC